MDKSAETKAKSEPSSSSGTALSSKQNSNLGEASPREASLEAEKLEEQSLSVSTKLSNKDNKSNSNNDLNTSAQQKLSKLRQTLHSSLIGQQQMIDSMLICLLSGGHMLLEGMPGLAKTTAAKVLAQGIEGKFHRIQFTPDLLPADLIGTDVFNQQKHEFIFKQGPIFQNILLADEINRAPAKVQSALLEAMEERQVTIGQKSYKLPDLYMVIATQNPIEQEGTYLLPEAQLDRFMMHVEVNYPDQQQELDILELSERQARNISYTQRHAEYTEKVFTAGEQLTVSAAEKGSKQQGLNSLITEVSTITEQAEIFAARDSINSVYVDPKLKEYIVSIVRATREPQAYSSELAAWVQHGASPRASIALLACSKAWAWLTGSKHVLPQHIYKVAANILRHRVSVSFAAQAEGIKAKDVIAELLRVVAIP